MFAVELSIVDSRFCCRLQIDAGHIRIEHCRQVMSDEPIATANVQYPRVGRNYVRDFERHVISAPDLAAPAVAAPAALYALQQNVYRLIADKDSLLRRGNGIFRVRACLG